MPIKENLEKIKKTIPSNVLLVAAVKYASEEQIKELADAGLKDFGFNTYQQLKAVNKLIPSDARIHFIGHLQSNKVKNDLKNIGVMGLMTIHPLSENPEDSRKYFSLMKQLFSNISKKIDKKLEYLSMGMSNDYKTAIEGGANIVRIGRALFY